MRRAWLAALIVALVSCGKSEEPTTPSSPPSMQPRPDETPEQLECDAGDKLCGERCVAPGPSNGCAAEACEPCADLPHAEVRCSDDGACALDKCETSYGDCDEDGDNGCETPLDADLENCGACGSVCPEAPNAEVRCESGDCALACEKGFYDNDRAYDNGCEGETFDPVDPIAYLSPDGNKCPPAVPQQADECVNALLDSVCHYGNPALACQCRAQCRYPLALTKPAWWDVECHYCARELVKEWSLDFKSATLGDLGTIRAPQNDVRVGRDCDTLALDTDALLGDCNNLYIAAEVREQANGSEVAVFYFNNLTFAESSQLAVSGSRPLVLVADTISVNGDLNLAGRQVTSGAGQGQDAPSVAQGYSSGGGGGHCRPGGKSGSGALGGAAFASDTMPALSFGAAGGRSDQEIVAGGPGGKPDYHRAGGAIQLIAKTSITVGTTGSIRVDGWQGTSKLGGGSGGGNAGGTIILEAPAVTVDGYLSALGGEGGNEFDAPPGSDGVYTGGNGVDPDEGGGGGAGLILIYGDARTLFEPRITPAASTVCTQFLPLLH